MMLQTTEPHWPGLSMSILKPSTTTGIGAWKLQEEGFVSV